MKPFFAFIVPFVLLSVVSSNHARKDPAGDYWKMMMKDQPIPEAIRDLIIRPGSRAGHLYVEDFDIRPNIIIYHAHVDHRDGKSSYAEELKPGHDDDWSEELVNPALKVPDREQKQDHDYGA